MKIPPGVAAGHPATAAAAFEVLAGGGTAADAVVAGILAACVAEPVMTGFAGGGHALHVDGEGRTATTVDFFCAVPGLDHPPGATGTIRFVDIGFGEHVVPYGVGMGSVAVPGIGPGCDVLWRRWGRLPWPDLVAPARRLAADGVPLLPRHAAVLAMLDPVYGRGEPAARFARAGRLLEAHDRFELPHLAGVLDLVAEQGGWALHHGDLAELLLRTSAERGGLIGRRDLATYRVVCNRPCTARWMERTLLARADLTGVLAGAVRLGDVRGLPPSQVARRLARALGGTARTGDTTAIAVVDRGGHACVATISLGLASGDVLPGTDLLLNSMLGETELIRGVPVPGDRLASMMTPTVVVDRDGLEVVLSSAGASRIRSAIVQVLVHAMAGVDLAEAVARPRLHPVGGEVHLEPGHDPSVPGALAADGWSVREWAASHHFFGGVSAVGRTGAAGDLRRDGAAHALM